MSRRRRPLLIIGAFVALLAVGWALVLILNDGLPEQTGVIESGERIDFVQVSTWGCRPLEARIPEGASVTFDNVDTEAHAVQFVDPSLRDLLLEPGEMAAVEFPEVGQYAFQCGDARGEVVVWARD